MMVEKNSIRHERFVTESQGTNISEEDFRIARKSVLTIFEWLPKYFEIKEMEFKAILLNSPVIESKGSLAEKSNLRKIKTTMEYKDIVLKSFSNQKNWLTKCQSYLTDIDFNEELNQESKNLTKFERIMEKRRYPLIWLYTSDWGSKLWFHRKIILSWYSIEDNREFQFCDARESNDKDVDLLAAFEKGNRQRVYDSSTATAKIIFLYRWFVNFLVQFLQCEFQRLSINCSTNLGFVGDVYRGEAMSENDFQMFLEKITQSEFQIKLFAQDFSSTTLIKNEAIRFIIRNRKHGMVDVCHVLHIVRPNEKELEEFGQLFPEENLLSKSVNITELSEFRSENEVLIWNMKVLNIHTTNEDGIYFIESVGHGLTLYTDVPIPDEKLMTDEYMLACQLDRQLNTTSARVDVLRKYPQLKALYYLQTLNNIASFRWARNYFSSLRHRDDLKAQLYSQLIDDEHRDLAEFMKLWS